MPVGAVQSIARLYEEHKQLSSTLNAKLFARSKIGDKIRNSAGTSRDAAKEEAKALKAEISSLETQLAEADEVLYRLALSVPNDTHKDSPIGPEDAVNFADDT